MTIKTRFAQMHITLQETELLIQVTEFKKILQYCLEKF